MGWTLVQRDVLINPSIRLSYGISGSGPTDLVASTGTLSFALDNSEHNSAGLLSYYSTDVPAACRPGFRRGIGVRYSYRPANTYNYYRKHVGRLINADPESGQYESRRTLCDSADWMNEAANVRPTVPAQIGKRADEVLPLIMAAVPRQPTYTSFDIGDSVFPYALDNSRSEGTTVAAEIQRICQSEFGRFVLRGTLNQDGMIARFEKRSARLVPLPVAMFTGTMQDLKPSAMLRNRVKVTAHPRRVDSVNTTVLYSKPDTSNPAIGPGKTITVRGRYTDPSNPNARVGGTDMIAPVATTDYLLNAQADGLGADLTANLSVLATFGANEVEYRLTNTGGVQGFITKLRNRGRGIYDYDPFDAVEIDQASIDLIGESPITLDMPYQADIATAAAVAEFLVDTWLTPGASEARLRFIPRDEAEMAVAMSLEPGDPIAVSELVTGVNGVYYIQQVNLTVDEPGSYKTVFDWVLQRALVQNYWQLGVAGFSELGISTVLAPL
jgi:hypothetical protein